VKEQRRTTNDLHIELDASLQQPSFDLAKEFDNVLALEASVAKPS